MANYLVTGAAGFIASRVAEMLLEEGHSVVGIDNLNDAYDVRVKHWRLARLEGRPGFTFHHMDIGDRAGLSQLCDQQTAPFDAVINLAARAGVRTSVIDPWVYVETNMVGTLNLLELCRQRGIPKFILASTSSLYGTNNPMPFREDANTDFPLQPYAASKKGAEAMSYAYHYLHGLDVTVLRYFTVYGPAGRPEMVMFNFIQWIREGREVRLNGDGEQKRGFTYLDDIARGTIAGLKPLGYEIINLGGHELITINKLIEMIEQRLGRKAQVVRMPLHPADTLANWADVQKAKMLLGWEPQVSLEEGVTNAVNWYLAERSWAAQILTP
jgi:nucleoside-diphosphate-sugar epimerase